MEMSDPFFVVKNEVEKTTEVVKSLYTTWKDLPSGDEHLRVSDELRNNLRSIEWDLEDLEETIKIASRNPQKFNLSDEQVKERKAFVDHTKQFTTKIRNEVENQKKNYEKKVQPNILQKTWANNNNYTRLQEEEGGGHLLNGGGRYVGDDDDDDTVEITLQQQKVIMGKQDEQLEGIGRSVRGLKHVSALIANELDEQAVMIDDLGEDMDKTETRMDGVMKKMAKVLHLNSDRKQWVAICILLLILFILVILLVVL